MLHNYTELGFLWEAMPPKMYPLFHHRRPSLIYFYEIEPVIEFVWRWKSDFYDPFGADGQHIPQPYLPQPYSEATYRGTHFRDVNVAWYIGSNYRVECQFMDWRKHIKLPTPPPNLRSPRRLECARRLIEEGPPWTGYHFIPFDREHVSEILDYIWTYLQRTGQLDALFWK